jgi:hypothetical protein
LREILPVVTVSAAHYEIKIMLLKETVGTRRKMFKPNILVSSFPLRALHVTSAASTIIFALVYGIIEHTLLTSPVGISILEYPLSVHIVGQIYFYHVLLFLLAVLISFNPFFDILLFGAKNNLRIQALLWGIGNILNFLWLEDMSYFVLFGGWPKDVMTPLHLSFYGVVWWYPVLFALGLVSYYLAMRSARKANTKMA